LNVPAPFRRDDNGRRLDVGAVRAPVPLRPVGKPPPSRGVRRFQHGEISSPSSLRAAANLSPPCAFS
jgi:hypothetical protein